MSGSLVEQGHAVRQLPRSERVKRLFGFEPWDYQAEVLDAPENAEDTDVEVSWVCGRQVGKTTTASAIPADYALTHAGEDVLIAGRFQETADELFRETKKHLEATGLTNDELGLDDDNKSTYEFSTGSRIMSRTLGQAGKQQRGKNPKCIVVEEAALVLDDVYEKVIEPMFATHDEYELYLISTPRGKSGYLYDKHVYDDDWLSFTVPTSASPLVTEEWLEKRRSKVDAVTFDQEYLGEFVELGEVYLPKSLVRPCVRDESSVRDLDRGQGVPAWLGVDPARSGTDRSVYISIDANGTVFALTSEQSEKVNESVGRILSLDQKRDYRGILIDENAVGGGVVDFASEDLHNVVPITFSSKSKQSMYQNLRKAFESELLTLPDHDRLFHEVTSLQFSYTQTGILKLEHPPGGHDDYADALALAVHGWQTDAGAVTRDTRSGVSTSARSGQSRPEKDEKTTPHAVR